MMSPLLSYAVSTTLILYGVAILLALWRVLRGPSAQDRVLASASRSILSAGPSTQGLRDGLSRTIEMVSAAHR